MVRNSDGTL
jgi:hypothetical protein